MYKDLSFIKDLYPFESHYIKVRGLDYHYIDEGSGEPIIMIHGNPTWSFFFRELIKGLSKHYRTIAPDHIGCGLSEKPGIKQYDFRLKSRIEDLEFFLNKLSLTQKITLVLHDWGGIIGIAYALRHLEKIGRLIIMNTAAFLPRPGKSIPLRLWLIRNIRPFAGPAVLGLNLFAKAAVHMASFKKLAKSVKQGLLFPYNYWNNRLATLKFVQDIPLKESDESYYIIKDAEANLGGLDNIPMLILWGIHDFVFDMDYFKEWQKRFPNAIFHTFSEAGHYILEDVPEKVLECIKEFLKKC
jgi:haloalkane dehalogenase